MKKRIFAILLVVAMCFCLASCGDSGISLKNEVNTYTNAAGTISIDLIDKWIASENVSDETLDVTYRDGTVNVHIECLSKGQAANVADDLKSYSEYSRKNLDGVLSSAKFTEADDIIVPDFVNNSIKETFTIEDSEDNKLDGILVFMESDKCYYTCLIMAVEMAWNVNEDVLKESVSTIKEISEIPTTEAAEEE